MDKPTKTARELLEAKRSETTGVISVTPEDTILSALKLMEEKNVGAVVVLEKGKLVGIMTERDYARKVEVKGRTAKDTLVREIMTGDRVIYVTPSDPVDKCKALLKEYGFRHLPVYENDRVTGLLSIRDILEEIILEDEHLIHDLESDRLMMTTYTGSY
jgi:CBS domain-containing protein